MTTQPLPTTTTTPVGEPHSDDVAPDDHTEPAQDPDVTRGNDDDDDDDDAA